MHTEEVRDTEEGTDKELDVADYTENSLETDGTAFESYTEISGTAVDPLPLLTGQIAQPMGCPCSGLFLAA